MSAGKSEAETKDDVVGVRRRRRAGWARWDRIRRDPRPWDQDRWDPIRRDPIRWDRTHPALWTGARWGR